MADVATALAHAPVLEPAELSTTSAALDAGSGTNVASTHAPKRKPTSDDGEVAPDVQP